MSAATCSVASSSISVFLSHSRPQYIAWCVYLSMETNLSLTGQGINTPIRRIAFKSLGSWPLESDPVPLQPSATERFIYLMVVARKQLAASSNKTDVAFFSTASRLSFHAAGGSRTWKGEFVMVLGTEEQRGGDLRNEFPRHWFSSVSYTIINVKNSSLYTLLTATDLKPEKS